MRRLRSCSRWVPVSAACQMKCFTTVPPPGGPAVDRGAGGVLGLGNSSQSGGKGAASLTFRAGGNGGIEEILVLQYCLQS